MSRLSAPRDLRVVTVAEGQVIRCACCHRRPPCSGLAAVLAGRPSLRLPAVYVCGRCLLQGLSMIFGTVQGAEEAVLSLPDADDAPPRGRPS